MPVNISEKLAAKKAAIYIRVSTHWQIDKDSLKVQRRELIAYVELVLGITDYEVFEDPGYSAKNTDRPDYQAMMERIRTGEFTHLVVWKIDRISRNLLDFAYMYDELKRLGVTFVSKNEQFDTSTAIGEAMLKIILVFAELERNMTSERVTAVMLSRANNGQWNGGRIPYGYSWDKESGTFAVVEQEAKVANRMAELYEQYQSLLYVVKYMNDAGITTLHDTTLHDSPSYTESYARSAQTARRYLEEYPSIKVVLDVHRDAMESGDARVRPLTTLDGQPTAQVMIIAGCNNGGTVQLPNWRLNLCFAAKWEERMEMLYPGLTRPVLCGYRFYNQDVSPGALLIEIGGHANTVQQAVRAGQYAAKALAALFDGSV